MDESKRKEIEAKLQQLFAESDRENLRSERIIHSTGRTVRVIRRRKGRPDLQLAS
jgi:hypothetical protein